MVQIPKSLKASAFFLNLPAFWYFGPWMSRTSFIYPWLMGTSKRFSLVGLAIIYALFSIDDWGTAIGMQATEKPRLYYEGNSFMVAAWDYLIKWGLVDTYTGAMRLNHIWMFFWILVAQFTNTMSPYFRMVVCFMAISKPLAGFMWWSAKPNQYTITDFLTFKPGRQTPERASPQARSDFNEEIGYDSRRRLTNVFSENTLKTVFYLLFPGI